MARSWWEVKKNKRVHAYDGGRNYLCGTEGDPAADKKLPRKPKGDKICKNCLRVINKKK